MQAAYDDVERAANRAAQTARANEPNTGTVVQNGCFAAGTPILRVGGQFKRIEHIQVGDLVLSLDEDHPDSPLCWQRVVQTHARFSAVITLHVQGQTLRLTEEHPIYIQGRGWVPAGQVQPGEFARTKEGQSVLVDFVDHREELVRVYNLTIEKLHTFFVGEPSWGFSIWVHNVDLTCDAARKLEKRINAGDQTVTADEIDALNRFKDARNLSRNANLPAEIPPVPRVRPTGTVTATPEMVAALRTKLNPIVGEDVLAAVTRGIEDDVAKVHQTLDDLNTIVESLKSRDWRHVRARARLHEDARIRDELHTIFVDNMQRGRTLDGMNPQDLLHDLAEISDLKGFKWALNAMKSRSGQVRGDLAEIMSAARDRRAGKVVEDIKVKIPSAGGKETDVDVISDGTLWQYKVGDPPLKLRLLPGEEPRPTAWGELENWAKDAIEAAKNNNMTKIGFRLDARARVSWHFDEFDQEILARLRRENPTMSITVDSIPTPPIPVSLAP